MFPRLLLIDGGADMWDRIKNWKKDTMKGLVCPLCQHKNTIKAETCKSCSYQLNKPINEQISNIEESETNDLFDELMNESTDETDDQVIDWSNATFKMDDVTIDVNQYTEEEEVFLSSKPNVTMISGTIEIPNDENYEEQDYELVPSDAPSIPVKFEIPEEEPEIIEEIGHKQVDLIQPTSGTPDNVQVVPAEQITEEINEINILDAADFDGDGDVDEYEEAFFNRDEIDTQTLDINQENIQGISPNLPSAPINLPPFIKPNKIDNQDIIQSEKENKPILPSAPASNSSSTNKNFIPKDNQEINYWPWEQQDEWMFTELKDQVLSAMKAAIEKNIAQATVIIDEVGPHLGNQTNLMYPIGKLLDTIGRRNAVDKMIISASKSLPNDPNIIQAKQKLRP